jgi:hypothetical protein
MPFPNVSTQFGQPNGNRRAIAPRRGVTMSKRKVRELQHAVLVNQAICEVAPMFEGDALAFFKSLYANEGLPLETRIAAASRAVQFERPALAAIASRAVGPAQRTLEELLIEKSRIAEERGVSLTAKAIEGQISDGTDTLSVGH